MSTFGKEKEDTSCLTLDQLINYSEKSTSEKEQNEIEEHLKECNFCSDALEGITLTSGKEKVKDTVNSINHEIHERVSSMQIKKSGWRIYYSIAAILLLTIVSSIYLFFGRQSHNQTFDKYFKPYPNSVPLLRSAEPSSTLQKAMIEYEVENYERSQKLLVDIPSGESNYITAQFYLGVSNLCLNQSYQAIINLKAVVEDNNNDLKEPALWYLGLTYLKNKDIENAKSIFQKIVSINGIYRQKSLQVLQERPFKDSD